MKYTVDFYLSEKDNKAEVFNDIINGNLAPDLLEGDRPEHCEGDNIRKYTLTISMGESDA